jgi:hypothetical protein
MGRPLNSRFFDPVPASNGEGVVSYTITNAGSYTAVPTVAVSAPGLPGGVSATLGAVSMKALSATVTVGGTGATNADYAPGNTLTVSGGTGTAPVFTVSSVKVRTAANVADAGGFLNGNTVTFSTGFSTPAVLTLTVDGGGAITGLAVTNAGVRTTALPTDPVTPDSTNGPGTLAGTTFNLGFEVNAISLTTAGSLTALPANPAATTTNSSTGGTGATLTVAYGVLSVAVTNGGSGYVNSADAAITFTPASTTASTAVLTTTGTNVLLAHAHVVGGTTALDADIVKQTGTSDYVMTTTEGTSICGLVPSNSPAAGQAYIIATDSAANTYWVLKLTAHKAVLRRRAGGTWIYPNGYSAPWSLAAASGAVVSIESV